MVLSMTTVLSISFFRWRSALLWRTFFTTAVVAVVLRGLIGFCRSGKCGLFGQGGLIMFDLSSTTPMYSTQDIIAIVVLGVIGGVFGGLFNFLLDRILRAYSFINEYVWSLYICLYKLKF
jgi:chloride channel 7